MPDDTRKLHCPRCDAPLNDADSALVKQLGREGSSAWAAYQDADGWWKLAACGHRVEVEVNVTRGKVTLRDREPKK